MIKKELLKLVPKKQPIKTGMLMYEVQTNYGWNLCRDRMIERIEKLCKKT